MGDTPDPGMRLTALNRMYRTIIRCNQHMIRERDEESLAQKICETMVEHGGYLMAWVGYALHDENRTIKPFAYAGVHSGYLEGLNLTWADNEHGIGPGARAIRDGTLQVTRDILHDPQFLPWRDEAIKRGYASSIALPLRGKEGTFGFLGMYSTRVDAFDAEEVDLLKDVASDLAFGTEAIRARIDRDDLQSEQLLHLHVLEHTLETTVQALASTLETRDPYTAGHGQRVAGLATATARELGLTIEEVHGIHLAGMIHDVGKIGVPAEILTKPTRLTDIEFALIRTHAQAGFDILKGIDFPWPIAQLVVQHHERSDGSGCPRGLKDAEMLIGAKILVVADTVEAMASHRPYRPAMGIEFALTEIESRSGTLFNPQVVACCLRLFREKKYRLPD